MWILAIKLKQQKREEKVRILSLVSKLQEVTSLKQQKWEFKKQTFRFTECQKLVDLDICDVSHLNHLQNSRNHWMYICHVPNHSEVAIAVPQGRCLLVQIHPVNQLYIIYICTRSRSCISSQPTLLPVSCNYGAPPCSIWPPKTHLGQCSKASVIS